MKFSMQYPIAHSGYDPALLEPEGVIAVVQAAENTGFGGVAFTDHPAPSHKWLQAGGHDSFDPLTALAFCAAATKRIRLQTYLLVLPYRNPLLAAKQIATVDVLSGARPGIPGRCSSPILPCGSGVTVARPVGGSPDMARAGRRC